MVFNKAVFVALESSPEDLLKSDETHRLISQAKSKGESLATEINEDSGELQLWVADLQPKPQAAVQLARGLPFYALAGYLLFTVYSA